MSYRILLPLTFLLLIVGGCSGKSDEAASEATKQDNVFKEKTDTIDKAKQTEQLIMDAAQQQQRDIEKQTQQQ
jgi:hypothetical protein